MIVGRFFIIISSFFFFEYCRPIFWLEKEAGVCSATSFVLKNKGCIYIFHEVATTKANSSLFVFPTFGADVKRTEVQPLFGIEAFLPCRVGLQRTRTDTQLSSQTNAFSQLIPAWKTTAQCKKLSWLLRKADQLSIQPSARKVFFCSRIGWNSLSSVLWDKGDLSQKGGKRKNVGSGCLLFSR